LVDALLGIAITLGGQSGIACRGENGLVTEDALNL